MLWLTLTPADTGGFVRVRGFPKRAVCGSLDRIKKRSSAPRRRVSTGLSTLVALGS
jgi:hypothetical protein